MFLFHTTGGYNAAGQAPRKIGSIHDFKIEDDPNHGYQPDHGYQQQPPPQQPPPQSSGGYRVCICIYYTS